MGIEGAAGLCSRVALDEGLREPWRAAPLLPSLQAWPGLRCRDGAGKGVGRGAGEPGSGVSCGDHGKVSGNSGGR